MSDDFSSKPPVDPLAGAPNPVESTTPTSETGQIPWGPIAAILVSVGVFFAAQILGALLVGLYPLILQHANKTQALDLLNNSVGAQFAYILVVEAITLFLLWLFLRARRASFKTLGLKLFRLHDIGYAIGGFIGYFLLYIFTLKAVQALVPQLNTSQKQQLGFNHVTSGTQLVLVFISLVVLPPITEEILVRGFLYSGLKSKLPTAIAVIITSALFAAAHLQFGSGAALVWVAALDTFVLSLVLIYLREKTGSLWASILLHALKNGIAFASLFIFHLS